MVHNVHDIANKIILRTDTERGDVISNLKLQKLLYYLQGYHLAFFNEVLFEDDLEAWMYGPVVPSVYRRFKEHKALGIVLDPAQNEEVELQPEVEDLFNQVMQEYGKFSAIKLMEMTHSETPWKAAFARPDKKINNQELRKFFKAQVDE